MFSIQLWDMVFVSVAALSLIHLCEKTNKFYVCFCEFAVNLFTIHLNLIPYI